MSASVPNQPSNVTPSILMSERLELELNLRTRFGGFFIPTDPGLGGNGTVNRLKDSRKGFEASAFSSIYLSHSYLSLCTRAD
jgi:hypothetical protein